MISAADTVTVTVTRMGEEAESLLSGPEGAVVFDGMADIVEEVIVQSLSPSVASGVAVGPAAVAVILQSLSSSAPWEVIVGAAAVEL